MTGYKMLNDTPISMSLTAVVCSHKITAKEVTTLTMDTNVA